VNEYGDRLRIAEHESCHAIAAQEMGLPVSWVTIERGTDEGVIYMAAVKIPDELIDAERDCFAICVAMSAPVHLTTHLAHEVGRYARAEALLAYELGGRNGHRQADIWDRASDIVDERHGDIVALAYRLLEEGTVTMDAAAVA